MSQTEQKQPTSVYPHAKKRKQRKKMLFVCLLSCTWSAHVSLWPPCNKQHRSVYLEWNHKLKHKTKNKSFVYINIRGVL